MNNTPFKNIARLIEAKKEEAIRHVLLEYYGIRLTNKNARRISKVFPKDDPGYEEYYIDHGKKKQRWILSCSFRQEQLQDGSFMPTLDIKAPIKIDQAIS